MVKAGFLPQPFCAPSPPTSWPGHQGPSPLYLPVPSYGPHGSHTHSPLCPLFVGLSVCSQPLHPVTQQLPFCKFPLCPREIPTASGPGGSLGTGLGWSQGQPVGSCPLLPVPEPRGSPWCCQPSQILCSWLPRTPIAEGKELATEEPTAHLTAERHQDPLPGLLSPTSGEGRL